MRAILEDMKSGEISVYDVPPPELRPGGVLVRTAFSAISSGTERVKVETGEKSLVAKAMARPDLVRQVIDHARTEGIVSAYQRVRSKLDALSPMGYSCSGIVLAASEDVTEFKPGDRVACGGGGYANHCEVNFVPKNLVVHVPAAVPLDAACLTTIGAIALQGVRQAQVELGETVAVIGAGLVGFLTIQLLRAAGCRVVAIDLDPERARRAAELGAHLGLAAGDPNLNSSLLEFSRYGADAAIVTAAAPSAAPVELAAKVLRDRGRIIVVGDVQLGVSRSQMYHKELSLALSRSYGPGRYDPSYEESGVDYPIGFVRWTEKRNMEAFLDMLATGAIDVQPLLASRYAVDEGNQAYANIREGKSYTSIIAYPSAQEAVLAPKPASVPSVAARRTPTGALRVGCIGAGGFARNHIIPNLRCDRETALVSVATASGITAEAARKSFGFARAQSTAELLAADDVDAVFIVSRHASHAEYVTAALRAGKSVFVEKPLAIDRDQLRAVCQCYATKQEQAHNPFLMVGFNRRFAPMTRRIRDFFGKRSEPMMLHVRVNGGYLPRDHWTQQAGEGGRIIGEFCHFVDWARSIVAQPITAVRAAALPDGARYNLDNVAVMLSFADGSIANLLYVANGDRAIRKEYFEVYCQGGVARLEDFQLLELARSGKLERTKSTRDKGHRDEIALTLKAMRAGLEAPIPFAELVEVTHATLAVHDAVRTGDCVPVPQPTTADAVLDSQGQSVGARLTGE